MTTGVPAGQSTSEGVSILAGDSRRVRTSEGVGVVGERALAAVRVEDGGQVDVYHSRWAGGDSRLRQVFHGPGDPLDALADAGWGYRGQQDRTAFPDSVDTLGVDAVYLFPGRGVRVYLPVWLGIPGTAEQIGGSWAGRATDGLLLRVEAFGECRRLRGMARFLKELFCVAVRQALVDRQTARDLLALALRSDHTPGRVHPPGAPL